jgi:hypothetical protein
MVVWFFIYVAQCCWWGQHIWQGYGIIEYNNVYCACLYFGTIRLSVLFAGTVYCNCLSFDVRLAVLLWHQAFLLISSNDKFQHWPIKYTIVYTCLYILRIPSILCHYEFMYNLCLRIELNYRLRAVSLPPYREKVAQYNVWQDIFE